MALHSCIIFSLLPLLLFPLNISCQNTSANVSLGSSFSPSTNTSWLLSSSGDFAFGFRALDNDSTRFLLAVHYNKIHEKTVIWTANRGNPVSSRSVAQLTSDGQLILQDRSKQQIWSSNTTGAIFGSMLDNGNFILSNGSSVIWQTFDFPTDTLLPGQTFTQGSAIYAKITDDDYSIGRFMLTLQSDDNLVGYALGYPTTRKYDPYYASNTDKQGNNQLVFNETGSLYLLFDNGTNVPVLSKPALTGDDYLRATLDTDGNLRQYSFPKMQPSTGSWSIEGNLLSGICGPKFYQGSGICGYNSYCTQSANGLSNCQCLPHYIFIDPTRKYKGCIPDFASQVCEQGSGSSFAFETMKFLHWPYSDGDILNEMNESQCQKECLDDCFCSVAIYSNRECRKKKFPLSNGRSDREDSLVFIKYNTLNISMVENVSSRKLSKWKSWAIAVSSILIGSAILNILQISACFCMHRKRKPERNSSKTSSICSFTYKELEEATNGFSEELGKGAFGVVYKGVMPSQSTLIAVKKLEGNLLEEAEKDFENEVATICQTHHKNLVQLLGFCNEGSHRLIVFEFLSKGSLDKFIFKGNRPKWNERLQIALGIANGLSYLHEECRTQIIHCDIKPQNILLSDNMEARISDFGLAKLLGLDQTRTSTGIRGTIGYFAPEWFKNVAITTKVDVYSFGVVLLQIICCRKYFECGNESQGRTTVIDWAKTCHEEGRLDLLVEDDEEAKRDTIRLERFVMVGIFCVEDEPWLRPSMKKGCANVGRNYRGLYPSQQSSCSLLKLFSS